MGKEGYSREGFFGEIIHYDSKGNKIGESRPGFWGDTYSNYDAKGNKIGEANLMNSFVSGIIGGITIGKSSIYKSVYFYGSSDNCSYAVDKATQAYATQNPEKKIVRITGDEFAEEMISSIKNGTSDRFKSEMANADFLIMEQIDSIAGKEASMQLFYGIFDKVYESGRQIIVTGSVPPKDIPALANRIRTQLEGGIMCRLEKETV